MKIEINQKIDEAYYQECYRAWLNHRSKFKKWEHKIGFISVGLAVLIFLFDSNLLYISGGLLVFGILMIFEFYSSKNKWMKDRLKSKMNNKEATFIFEEDKIQSIGPFTELNSTWDYFSDAIETEKGLLLIPENGIMIYLQKTSFDNKNDVNRIIEKINNVNV